jgi:hypothetical protein
VATQAAFLFVFNGYPYLAMSSADMVKSRAPE